MDASIQERDLEYFRQLFDAEPGYTVAMNAVTVNGVDASAKNFEAKGKYLHSFNVEVESGKACNQKQSGRCWMFASLNVMRLDVMEKLNLENMELSQNYPLFYDKLEKANYFLENMLKTLDEPVGSRLLHFLLMDPLGDGGQWDMFRSLVAKYGVVPKEIMPETAASSATRELRDYLTKKLREYACRLREAYRGGAGMDELRGMKDDMMAVIYRMLVIALGKPPVRFSWSTRDKDKNYVEVKDITPQEFFEKYVGWDLDEYVTVINAPTSDKPFGKTFTVQYLGNVSGGAYPVKYLNLPDEELKSLAIRQLKDGKTVWFGSDVGQFSETKTGILACAALGIAQLFGTTFGMNKAERLDYGESLMTHAMVITGVELDENDRPLRWKVENSWGDEVGKDGYYVMSDEWFSEFVYQILLEKKYFSPEQAAAFEQEPIELLPWDPMGSLAF